MPAEQFKDLSRLCVHTITTKPWSIEQAVDKFSAAGVSGITVWRDAMEGRDPVEVGKMITDKGLDIVSLCRGGFFSHVSESDRLHAIDENKVIIDEAAAIGAPLVVLVCGADPGQPLEESRKQIVDGIAEIAPYAESSGVKLAIEPLHPMYADDRSAINTMKQANDAAVQINSDFVGVAVDVYHLWWDPELESEIKRCGEMDKIFAFHICDWKTPTVDLLLDRGLMGEGCIDIRKIRGWVEDAGFSGYNEVEIFSNIYWDQDQDAFLDKIVNAYKKYS